MAKSLTKAVAYMKSIANDDSHGYDQVNRMGPDFDCSSLVGHALAEGGFNVSPASTTRNLKKQLEAEGFKECKAPWKAGDVHLKEGHHVVMSISPTKIAHASINENGKVSGGKTGDQTGKEICIRDYYEYKGGWDYHLRYEKETKKETKKDGKKYLVTQVDALRLRTGAGLGFKIVKTLAKGTKIEYKGSQKVVGSNTWAKVAGGWICVKYGGETYAK